MRTITNAYKIHCLNTANGKSRSGGNDTFYETYGEAKQAAELYASRNSNPAAMVIYRAIELVEPVERPTISRRILGDGTIETDAI
jgi:hypothetical protein